MKKSHYRAQQFDLMSLIEKQAGYNGLIPTFVDHAIVGHFKSAPSRQFIKLKYGY